jgi:hypothetical protein
MLLFILNSYRKLNTANAIAVNIARNGVILVTNVGFYYYKSCNKESCIKFNFKSTSDISGEMYFFILGISVSLNLFDDIFYIYKIHLSTTRQYSKII